jgi:hypothetical protein
LIGAPTGDQWWRWSAQDEFIAVDPSATFGSSPAALISAYLSIPGGSIDVTAYVQETPIPQPEGSSVYSWFYTTLQSILEELAAYSLANVQFWLDPDLYFHWQAIPPWWDTSFSGGSLLLFPETPDLLDAAPANISDVPGSGEIGCRGLTIRLDGSTMPEAIYVKGGTGFILGEGINFGVVAVGGTGWALDIIGWADIRQAYLDVGSATTKELRDAIGGQARYRALYPTLRGSLTLHGTDGWRCGQVVRITDARLPDTLNGRPFVIQRVSTTLIPTQDFRVYTIDFGDGPTQRYSSGRQKKDEDVRLSWPAVQLVLTAVDPVPQPLSVQTITAQLTDSAGAEWKIPDRIVTWTLIAYDLDGAIVEGQGSLDPLTSPTDASGKARTELTAGDLRNIIYFVYATTPVM